MFILPIANEVNQSFSFEADLYPTTIVLKCPNNRCGGGVTSYPPIIDVFIAGYEPIYGIPLINGVDILRDYVASACIPVDYGTLMALSADGSDVTCGSLISGSSALVYLNPAESIFASLDFSSV